MEVGKLKTFVNISLFGVLMHCASFADTHGLSDVSKMHQGLLTPNECKT